MTTVYFIRHAESDISVRDGRSRPLTAKGMADRRLVTEFLHDKGVDAVLSSPFKRAVDTVADFADRCGFTIETDESFRERGNDCDPPGETEFFKLIERQWADFSYTLPDGECLSDVQARNIAALNRVLTRYKNKIIVIGTHGTALSTIINYYDGAYGFNDFKAIAGIMPWVVAMYFDGTRIAGMSKIDLYKTGIETGDIKFKVQTAEPGALGAYRFVVVFARYKDKWLYCQAKTRDTYETAGGHIESGKTPLDAARRELYEETGAFGFEITPAFDYSVHVPSGFSYGQVFFAKIHELGDVPNYEMAAVRLFDSIPDRMRFPQILPVLYDRLQTWLNLQSAN